MAEIMIFDCDGVLRSASWLGIYEAYKATCEYLGIDCSSIFPDYEAFRAWYNPDWKVNLSRLGVENEEIVPALNQLFHKVYDPYIQIFPWVDRVMQKLSSHWTVAVLSSSVSTSIAMSLGSVCEHVSMIVGCDHLKNIKPHPEGINRIMRRFEAKPKETWMIGDMSVDVLAGRGAGVWTATVDWGLTESREELISFGSDIILEDPDDLLFL